jgi:tRNA A-37 threonylcarbamoyl transferase component Bud32
VDKKKKKKNMPHLAGYCFRKFFIALLLVLATPALSLFEDASSTSDFGSNLNIVTPWAGQVVATIRFIDLNGDGFDEILIGGEPSTCSSSFKQISVFRHDPSTNRYEQIDYGKREEFLGLNLFSYYFEELQRFGSALPDIIACHSTTSKLVVLENHGEFNFSISGVSFSSPVACELQFSLILVADTNRDGSDEVFFTTYSATRLFTRLSNATLVSANSFLPVLPLLHWTSGTFADLDSDSYVDLIWTGWNYGPVPLFILHNDGSGNFSIVPNTLGGSYFGSVVVAELSGDDRPDIFLTGISRVHYKNNGSMTFHASATGIPYQPSVYYLAAAVPLRSQTAALDLVLVLAADFFSVDLFSNILVLLNDGTGNFTPIDAGWLPTSYRGQVVRGPDVGLRPSFLAMGLTNSSTYDGSLIVGYIDSGSLLSYVDGLFVRTERTFSLYHSLAVAADFNYDGCADVFFSGLLSAKDTLSSVMAVGDCSGSLQATSVTITSVSYGNAIVRDFDHDGLLEMLVSGIITNDQSEYQTNYFRFNSDGIAENLTLGLHVEGYFDSVLCAGPSSGSDFDDIFISGSNSRHYLRNARNGSFIDASADLGSDLIAKSGSCAFASPGANDTAWRDLFVIGEVFYFLENRRNGSFEEFPLISTINYASLVAADLNGDGRDDIFYNGISYTITSGIYMRHANGSLIKTTGLAATGDLTKLPYSSIVAFDMDSDGDVDLAIAGADISEQFGLMVALLNDGSGNFTDGTELLFGQLPGALFGSVVVAQLTNDSMADLMYIGEGSFCGPRVLLRRTNTTTSSTSSSSLPSPSSSSSGSSSSSLAAALAGGIGGGLGFILLLCVFLIALAILCACCILCLIVLVVVVAVALVAIVAVAIGLFAAGDVGTVVFLARGKKGKMEDVVLDEVGVAALLADAERTCAFRDIPWSEIHTVKKLGAGAFGEVMLAEWNGVEVAVKLFRNPTQNAIDEFQHEALMMAKVSHHPNVVNFIGASFPPDGMAMVLGLCAGGSLLGALEKKKLDAAMKTRILGEVASALSFLHSLGIVHRDIAARNVLLDGSGKAKLADLGLSRLLEDKQGEQQTASYVGPVRWMAPEAIIARKYSSASDAYSFGVMMAEVWSDGAVPYADLKSVADVAILVLQQGARPRIAPETPPEQAELMQQLFSTDPAQRPSMEDVRNLIQIREYDDRKSVDAACSIVSSYQPIPNNIEAGVNNYQPISSQE